jgi:hypothetical protein
MASQDVSMALTIDLRPIIDALGTLAEAMQSVSDACLMARDSLASPRNRPKAVILRSSCGHVLGVGLIWKRQRYITWKACR